MIRYQGKGFKAFNYEGKNISSLWSMGKKIWPEGEIKPEPEQDGEMILNIISPSDGFVDFSYILGNDPDGEYTENAILDWGDGSEIMQIIGNEYTTNKTKLQHTYNRKNANYKITIKGKIKWSGTTNEGYIPYNTKEAITSIELPTNNSPIQNITSSGFYNFVKLQSIQKGLLDKCATPYDFSFCFSNCLSLQSMPEGLFDKCTEITIFNACFSGCKQLQSIPEHLFDKCIKVSDFDYCFSGCSAVTSNLPTLWISHPSAAHRSCFNSCNKAPNYQDAVNAGWA